MSHAYAFRRPAVRRALSRAAANLVAVIAVCAIFGLKAHLDGPGAGAARVVAAPNLLQPGR